MVAMFGIAGTLASTDLIRPPWGMAIVLLPMLLMIPMVRAVERMQRAAGSGSPTATRYNRRMLAASFAYAAGLLAAVTLFDNGGISKPVAALLALLPTLPAWGMIWAMGRYVIEESDEYLRTRAVNAALIATGFLLTLATFWGFMTTFGVAPNVPTWAAVPVWAIGLAIGQLVNRLRGA
jgi:hypothetical protein